MKGTIPSYSDAPAALVMAASSSASDRWPFLRPEKLRAAMDSFADSWKQQSRHPYRMPTPVGFVVGGAGIGGAALFLYIAYVGLDRLLA